MSESIQRGIGTRFFFSRPYFAVLDNVVSSPFLRCFFVRNFIYIFFFISVLFPSNKFVHFDSYFFTIARRSLSLFLLHTHIVSALFACTRSRSPIFLSNSNENTIHDFRELLLIKKKEDEKTKRVQFILFPFVSIEKKQFDLSPNRMG